MFSNRNGVWRLGARVDVLAAASGAQASQQQQQPFAL